MITRVLIVIAVIIAQTAIIGYAITYERAIERQRTMTEAMKTLKKRLQTDDDVKKMGNSDLCTAIGGVYHNGSCE